MPFPMRIQPVDFTSPEEYQPVKSVVKSRFKRLFERRNSAPAAIEEFEPSSVCLAKMVQNFIENDDNSPESESELFNSDSISNSSNYAFENLKSLVNCSSITEKNLMAEISKIVDKNKAGSIKYDRMRQIVVRDLQAAGYNTSICKSRWEKSSSYPAGEYEYVDVIINNDRFIVDIDFRSEFEIARSTKTYKSVLEILPQIFVGKSVRLEKIINLVSESSQQSLKKKGLHFPPWRKAEYLKAKWLSPCIQNSGENSGQKISGTEPEVKTRNSGNGVKIITGF